MAAQVPGARLECRRKAAIEKMAGTSRWRRSQRFEEQKERHEGGQQVDRHRRHQPFGAYGYNPQGNPHRPDKGRNRSAVKVWDQRQYKTTTTSSNPGTRNIDGRAAPPAPLRARARREELDLRRSNHRQHRGECRFGHLRFRRSGYNKVNVLLLRDREKAMDEYIHRVEKCSHAPPRASSSTSESYCFHNCVTD